ncbi:hypothetical protein ABPD27_07985 [Levilactobacillus brevis]|uniref:lectin-like domain-containing protein n=1 Tax=Levilactobacillus brevis TaxID=1580 RepID=UPI0032E4F2F2
MGIKRWFLGGLALVVAGLLGGPIAQADNNDLSNAISSAPQGLPLNDYFKLGTFNTSTGGGNSAKVIDSNRGDGTQLVQLTDTTNEVGTIWTADNYRLNLNKNATASMWLYFGYRTSSVGDGMAFVLQNDARGWTPLLRRPVVRLVMVKRWGFGVLTMVSLIRKFNHERFRIAGR